MTRRLGALSLAATLAIAGLGVAATAALAPAASAQVPPATPPTPGSDLAGLNTMASAAGIDVEPLTPGLVGAGNVTTGSLVQASLPYAQTTATTGPMTQAVASPAYPGATAADAGSALETFGPFPPQVANALNDPAVATADYPAQVTTPSSSSYSPPGGSTTGVGASTAQTADGIANATSSLNDTAWGTAAAPLVEVTSAKATSSATVAAGTVQTTAGSVLGGVTIGGLIQIATVTSSATASSNASTGAPQATLQIGAVTVEGHKGYIDQSGVHLDGTTVPDPGLALANQALKQLSAAGVSVTLLSPTNQSTGAQATANSGAIQVTYSNNYLPNPAGVSPLTSAGLVIDLGDSQATADATPLPPIANTPPPAAAAPAGPSTPPPSPSPVSSSTPPGPVTPPSAGSGGTPAVAGTPATPGHYVAASPARVVTLGGDSGRIQPEPVGFLGLPIGVGWLALAIILSVVAAGPLLAYAHWQLLGGRRRP